MSRSNPRLIAVVLFAVTFYVAFRYMSTHRTDWREFAASDDTKITAFALLSHHEDGKDRDWMKTQPQLHGDIVLSQKKVQDATTRRELRQSFLDIALIESGPDCTPLYRHALRFEKDGRTVDAMICFQCGHMEVFDSAGRMSRVDFSVSNPAIRDQFDAIFSRLGMKQFKPYSGEEVNFTLTKDKL